MAFQSTSTTESVSARILVRFGGELEIWHFPAGTFSGEGPSRTFENGDRLFRNSKFDKLKRQQTPKTSGQIMAK